MKVGAIGLREMQSEASFGFAFRECGRGHVFPRIYTPDRILLVAKNGNGLKVLPTCRCPQRSTVSEAHGLPESSSENLRLITIAAQEGEVWLKKLSLNGIIPHILTVFESVRTEGLVLLFL